MARSTRTTWLKAVALVVALASLTINFGLIDLIDGYTGYIDQARNQVLDAGWGLVFGVIIPLGLLAQLRRPERRIAGIQQTVVAALALGMAGVAGEAWRYVALAAGIAGVGALLVALHPARATFLARGQHLDVVMLVLVAVAAVPSLDYVSRMASAQRHDLPPADAVSNGLHHWSAMPALALLVPLLVSVRASHDGLAHPGNQCLDCGGRMGDLLSPCAGLTSRERRPCVGVGGPRLGAHHIRRDLPAANP